MLNPARFCLELGPAAQGWLPVLITCGDLRLQFSASDVMNDPISELVALLTLQLGNGIRSVVFWLEPAAYQMTITRENGKGILEIGYLDDYQFSNASFPVIFRMEADLNSIIHPFRLALTRFATLPQEPGSWRHSPDLERVKFKQI